MYRAVLPAQRIDNFHFTIEMHKKHTKNPHRSAHKCQSVVEKKTGKHLLTKPIGEFDYSRKKLNSTSPHVPLLGSPGGATGSPRSNSGADAIITLRSRSFSSGKNLRAHETEEHAATQIRGCPSNYSCPIFPTNVGKKRGKTGNECEKKLPFHFS